MSVEIKEFFKKNKIKEKFIGDILNISPELLNYRIKKGFQIKEKRLIKRNLKVLALRIEKFIQTL